MRLLVLALLLCSACHDGATAPVIGCALEAGSCSCDFGGEPLGYQACPVDPLRPGFCCATPDWPAAGFCDCAPIYCYATSGSGGRCSPTNPPGLVSLADWCPAAGGACVRDAVSCACGDECTTVSEPLTLCDADTFGTAINLCSARGLVPASFCQ